MSDISQIEGRTLREPLVAGKPFTPTDFYPVGMGPNVAESLQPGERAVTIPLTRESVDGTFITPGLVVDVLFRSNPDESLDVPDATVTLLSRVKVLAVGQNTIAGTIADAKEGAEAQTVTLAVNETQARALKVVEGRGSLTLVLRSAEDSVSAEQRGPITLKGLLGVKERSQPFVSEIYRRGRLSTLTFQDDRRQKITLDPPYGLPVNRDPKDVPDAGLDVWFPPAGGAYYPGVRRNVRFQ